MCDSGNSIMAELLHNEEMLLENEIRHNNDALGLLIEERCIEIDEIGKKEYRNGAKLEELDGVLYITDGKSQIIQIAENAVLLIYEAVKVKKNQRTKANCSSIWVKNNGEWRVVFNQRTTINENSK